jgi:hypothetical protein
MKFSSTGFKTIHFKFPVDYPKMTIRLAPNTLANRIIVMPGKPVDSPA